MSQTDRPADPMRHILPPSEALRAAVRAELVAMGWRDGNEWHDAIKWDDQGRFVAVYGSDAYVEDLEQACSKVARRAFNTFVGAVRRQPPPAHGDRLARDSVAPPHDRATAAGMEWQ